MKRDTERAIYWLRQAAELAEPEAAFALGEMYEHGEGVEKSTEKARWWYDMAGTPEAEKRLGELNG